MTEELSDITTRLAERIRKEQSGKLAPALPTKPVCHICGGIGFVRKEYPVGHEMFGKVEPCECVKDSLYASISGLTPDEISNMTWNKILPRENVSKAVEAVNKTLTRGYGWVYIWGEVGLAKTVILKTAVAEACRAGRYATYTNMSEVMENLREAYDKDNPNYESAKRLENWSKINILSIDEFDRVKATEWVSEKQFRMMDTRYINATRKNTITLMAANVGPGAYDNYLSDRIEDGRFMVVELKGESLRSQMEYWDK